MLFSKNLLFLVFVLIIVSCKQIEKDQLIQEKDQDLPNVIFILADDLGYGGFSYPIVIDPKEGEASGTLYDMANDPKEVKILFKKYPEKVTALIE